MKRKWIKRIILILLIPILLFTVLIVSLYIPSVQNFIQKKATSYASEAVGMDINIGRIDLRFPLNLLLRDVSVVQEKDTLLAFQSLNVGVEVLPLLKKQVMLNKLVLQKAHLDTKQFIDGIEVKGGIGELKVDSRIIDLGTSLVDLNGVYLEQINLSIALTDTVEAEKDTTEAAIDWRILVGDVSLTESQISFLMPYDTLSVAANIPSLLVKNVDVDLLKSEYLVNSLDLSKSSVSYRMGNQFRARGFDYNDIELQGLSVSIDSIAYSDSLIQANIETFSFHEKSGLLLNSLVGGFKMTDKELICSNFKLETPASLLSINAHMPIDWCNETIQTDIEMDLHLDMKETAQFLGVDSINASMANWGPVLAKVSASGNSSQLILNEVYAELSDAFILTVQGALKNICSDTKRNGQIDLLGDLYDLTRFEKWVSEDGSIRIPKHILVRGMAGVSGDKFYSELSLTEDKGVVDLKGNFDIGTEDYSIQASIDSLDIDHFMPDLLINQLIVSLNAKGRGFDPMSAKSKMNMDFSLNSLNYQNLYFRNIDLSANLDQGKLTTDITSNNSVVKAKASGYYWLTNPLINLQYKINVSDIDLYKLGVSKDKMKEPVQLLAEVETNNDSVEISLKMGDLDFNFSAKKSFNALMDGASELFASFMKQVEQRDIDFPKLQASLPPAHLSWRFGNQNPLSELLSQHSISYLNSTANFDINPQTGMNGYMGVGGFRMDSLKLDSLLFTLNQDTTGVHAVAGVLNDKNKERGFRALLRGVLNQKSGSLEMDFETADDDAKGLLFGIQASPVNRGTYITLIPQEPIVAFSKFKFKDRKNWVVLRDDFRVFADIDMINKNQIAFKMSSNLKDTTSLQNMNIDIRRVHLNDITRMFPFLPRLDGYLTSETHYVQTDSTLQLSTELFVDSLQYERKLIGDLSLGMTWLPDGADSDLINMYLTHNQVEILMADGLVDRSGKEDVIDVNADFEHFPLHVLNVMFPDEEIQLGGDIDGHLHVSGTTDSPIINGELILDSVTVYSQQAGAKFLLDSRPIQIEDSKIVFKDFAIYTTDQNPFKINGTVDISDLTDPKVDLKLQARNYTLIDAKRSKESILYGKLFVGMDATIKGPVDALKMRGSMSVLDNTDITYVLTESPLTVQDRLGDLVQFTSFRDTTVQAVDTIPRNLGGMDIAMSIHIDPSVQFKVDLSADRSSRVALQGGGDLSMQYTPQGDLYLNGRYSMTGGILKYSLPIIPSKEFTISNESYIEWTGKVDNPKLNFIAKDRVRASVSEADGSSHMVNFDVIIGAKNRLENLELVFDVSSPENSTVENELMAMGKEERGKQAIALLATGVYLANSGKGSGLNMGAALNSVLQSQINALAGSLKNVSFSVGVEEYDMSEAGGKRTDYSFRYSQQFMNNRLQLIVGGRIKTGVQADNDLESFIDNISVEYRLDTSGTRFVRLFHNKNYESVLEGEITETGVGLVLRKKINRLGELFIFRKKKKLETE